MEKVVLFQNEQDCCGCSACINICPKQAITMQPDALGFVYPQIDATKCIQCGLCQRVCAFKKDYDRTENLGEPLAYAARHRDILELKRSQSGAMFIALSDYVFALGGSVYGAGYTEHFRVVHKRAITKEERDEFRGSKYVQSDLSNIFAQVKQDLQSGLTVLFTGTPCQVAGLRSFLQLAHADMEKLILVDMVCHGVPSPFYWRDYLAYLEARQGSKIVTVKFRDKASFGWNTGTATYRYAQDSTVYTYGNSFYQELLFRHSCSACPFANTVRPGDITIGDFWGWEKAVPNFYPDNKGTSLVLVNTYKGKEIFAAIQDSIHCVQAELELCLQPNLRQPTARHPLSAAFAEDYEQHGYAYVAEKYGDWGWKCRLKDKLRNIKNNNYALTLLWKGVKIILKR